MGSEYEEGGRRAPAPTPATGRAPAAAGPGAAGSAFRAVRLPCVRPEALGARQRRGSGPHTVHIVSWRQR